MRMAVTDRMGANTRPLELNVERTEWDCLPPLGALVCAIGQAGWRYIGKVISTDEAKRTYTIEVWTANNPFFDNLKNYHQAQKGV